MTETEVKEYEHLKLRYAAEQKAYMYNMWGEVTMLTKSNRTKDCVLVEIQLDSSGVGPLTLELHRDVAAQRKFMPGKRIEIYFSEE